MHLMQYEITLPADYDMGIIRERVASRGWRTDAFPGLGVKAYLIRERGRDGSPVNQYAPFYVWASAAGMARFLFEGPFDGICTDFGRPAVRTWQTLAVHPGSTPSAPAAAATRVVRDIPLGAALTDVVDEAVTQSVSGAGEPGVTATAVGVDSASWQIVHFTLWSGPLPENAPGERYGVLHVSDPHRHDLPDGRAW